MWPLLGWLYKLALLHYTSTVLAVCVVSMCYCHHSSEPLAATCSPDPRKHVERSAFLTFLTQDDLHAMHVGYLCSGTEKRPCLDFSCKTFLTQSVGQQLAVMSPRFHSNPLSHSACHRCATSYKLQGWLENSTCPLSENDFTFSLLPHHKSSKAEQQIEMQNSAVKPYLGESLFGLFSVSEHLISFFLLGQLLPSKT